MASSPNFSRPPPSPAASLLSRANSDASDNEIQLVEVSGLLAKAWEKPVEEELPTDVCTTDQLKGLPPECLSGDPRYPLRHEDEEQNEYTYHLTPMFYSVIFILIVELLERFSFYGINYTQTLYLTGAYDRYWSAGLSCITASSYVSVSVAIAYTAPFLGAYLADRVLGDYYSILFGAVGLYLPGLIVIALTTMPGILGDTFNTGALRAGLLCLWPIGTGVVKSIVNVFGAKQYHPLLQSSLIESYYVNFYMCINIGAVAGGILVPIVAQYSVTLAYWIPVCMLTLAVGLFTLGTPRYVRSKPKKGGDSFIFGIFRRKRRKKRKKHRPLVVPQEPTSNSSFGLWTILRIGFLIIPFNVAYSQMATTFIVQGTVMKKAFGFIDAASMNNVDALSVLMSGYVIGSMLYPELARRNIKIATTYKFAIGSALGALAIGCALITEHKIHAEYADSGQSVSILWQTFAYALIGMGEIFAVSSAYEVAFKASPPNQKGLASAVNLFCVGGIPNFLCIGLYRVGARWFRNSAGNTNISDLRDYATAKVAVYFWVLFIIALLGVVINLMPPVRNWVALIEDEAANALRTPAPTPRISKKPVRKKLDEDALDEATALLRVRKHRNYLKYGSGPALYKNSSFRAGAATILKVGSQQAPKKKPPRYVKYGHGLTLFKKNDGGGMEPVVRSELDAKTERGVKVLEKALEGKGKDMTDPNVSTATL